MPVRAKFKVTSIAPSRADDPDSPATVELYPVYSADQASENAQYWKQTPSGFVQLSTINAAAAAQFAIGAEYYVDFTPATEAA